MFKSACKWLTIGLLITAASPLPGQTESSVESTRSVQSPDGSKTVTVDRFTPVVDGQAERFSGRMLLRVTSNDGSAARQRYVEATQVRVMQPPVWIDGSRLCAFVYNVSKNSNGIVYFEPESNRALQVEFVMPTRYMAASGQIEQELTSLEITEFTESETLKTRNIPWKGGSAFPLVIKPLPDFQGQPWGLEFYREVNTALTAYRDFLKKHSINRLELEQASESFSPDEKWLGLLACNAQESWVLSIPLNINNAVQALSTAKAHRITGLQLSCMLQTDNGDAETTFYDRRYLTAWRDASHMHVVRESYDTESDEPVTQAIRLIDIGTGEMTDLATTATAVSPPAAPPQ